MKLNSQNESPPSPRLSEFKNFIIDIFKKRAFLISLVLGILVILIRLAIPGFSLHIVLGFSIIFLGFIWAAFLNHRELYRAYQGAVVTVPREKNKRSGVAISFVRENEYLYSIADPYAGQNSHITRMQNNNGIEFHIDERGIYHINGEVYYMMARGGLEINFQLFNSGDVPLDILSVYVDDNMDLHHLRIYLEGVFQSGTKVRFPLHLKKGEVVTLQTRHTISVGMGSNDALFAADMQSLPKTILYDLIVNTSNDRGKRQSYVAELSTPSKALIELYANQWREYDQQEYLILAGQDQAGDI